ncbi:DeoR family transcriptional regulator [Candidatus Dojkabacteria bacterium]|nr:DeoR family transcriptional regulator [Candidatus Dojkabacteria bacterium]
MTDIKFRKKSFKTAFLVFAATLAVAGVGTAIWKKFEKAGDTTGRALRRALLGLNERQKKIINMFAGKDKLTNGELERAVKGVTRRTLRRDLHELEQMNIIKQHGKTKGSYYTLVPAKKVKKLH